MISESHGQSKGRRGDVAKTAVVSGYASVDYPVRLPAALRGEQTATVHALSGDGWPRPGGAALYVARCLADAGQRGVAIATVGQDANGALYLEACRSSRVELTALNVTAEARTPWCMLLYHDDGEYTCLIDRGDVDRQTLTQAQRLVLGAAEFVCVAAGAAATSAAVLDCISSEAPLAWIAKRDPVCFPESLAQRLAQRADFIFCNAAERSAVDIARAGGARTGQAIIETRGAQGVRLEQGGAAIDIATESLRVRDATGAGDTLAGGVIANLLVGNSDLERAVRDGVGAARRLLLSRAAQEVVDADERRNHGDATCAQYRSISPR